MRALSVSLLLMSSTSANEARVASTLSGHRRDIGLNGRLPALSRSPGGDEGCAGSMFVL